MVGAACQQVECPGIRGKSGGEVLATVAGVTGPVGILRESGTDHCHTREQGNTAYYGSTSSKSCVHGRNSCVLKRGALIVSMRESGQPLRSYPYVSTL